MMVQHSTGWLDLQLLLQRMLTSQVTSLLYGIKLWHYSETTTSSIRIQYKIPDEIVYQVLLVSDIIGINLELVGFTEKLGLFE